MSYSSWDWRGQPTLPPFCTCGVNTYEVHVSDGWYAYHNVDTCAGAANISVPIKGELSADAQAPGYLMENFGPFNHTASKLDPNMVSVLCPGLSPGQQAAQK